MEWVSQKWGGRPHRRGELLDLGADGHGRWFYGPRGGTATFGSGEIRAREQDTVFLLRDGWWCASWWFDHPEVAVYVDIATPPQWHDAHVVTVDLDLDVIRFVDGRVEVHDRRNSSSTVSGTATHPQRSKRQNARPPRSSTSCGGMPHRSTTSRRRCGGRPRSHLER